MAERKKVDRFVLVVPLDASGVRDFKPEQAVKVAVRSRDGSVQSKVVELDEKGRGVAEFSFRELPGALRVVVGPETVSDDELFGMQTIGLDVSARLWRERTELTLPPVVIDPYYWHWWLRWCRNFTIRGKVVCQDGNPVPGATVCAYDADYWWWWSSRQKVGCATTDATGAFEMKFRWCCGWWPWWWWLRRVWRLEPVLADKILPILRRDLKLRRIPLPDPKPDISIFRDMLEDVDLPREPTLKTKGELGGTESSARRVTAQVRRALFDPTTLDALHKKLKDRLPVLPELERLRLWPWWPWHPWWDCTPDIVFSVTQNCLGTENTIVEENVWDTRWNIPDTLHVTLVANEDACCVQPHEDPEGNCMIITHACDDQVQHIGGNPDASATPKGYMNPGTDSPENDRPYAENIPIRGLFGDHAGVDYYEFEWSDDDGATWNDMPAAAAGGFSRTYWGPTVGGGPLGFHGVPFAFTDISGRRVVMSRERFEQENDPASWGISRFWTHHRDLLMVWRPKNVFSDGTYRLRVKSWNLDAKGNLVNERELPLCNKTEDNHITLTIDNRFLTSGPTCPNGHVCGAGTVHYCTAEPDTDFIDVKILHSDGTDTAVGACEKISIKHDDKIQIDFMAHDPDGHLSMYTLRATYGENLAINLLSPSILNHLQTTFTPSAAVAPVPPASQVGPYYGHPNATLSALDQGATRPKWYGGAIRLIALASLVFPTTCCYQLELRAHKRTIVNCDESLWGHTNYSEYSFMIIV